MDLQRLLRPARVPELPEAEMLRESAEDDILARIVEDAGGARAATGVQANSRVPYATAKALADNKDNGSMAEWRTFAADFRLWQPQLRDSSFLLRWPWAH